MAECGCNVPRLETPFGDDIDYCSLHAAAPDLLAALGGALGELKYDYDQNWRGSDTPPGYGRQFEEYEAAIAKAKGES